MTTRIGYLSDQDALYNFISTMDSNRPCKLISANSYLASELGQDIGYLMSQDTESSSLRVSSVALARWFEAHWAQHGNGHTLISAEQRDILLSEVIESHKGSILLGQPSTVQLLHRVIQWGTKNYGGNVSVASQLDPIVRQYRKRIASEGFIEVGQACECLEKAKYINNETLIFWSIDDIQQPLARLVGTLADRDCPIWFIYGDTQSSYMRRYQHRFVSSIGPIDEVVSLGGGGDSAQPTALGSLQKGIFDQGAKAVKMDDSIAFLGADSPISERFAVVREVRELIAKGHSPESIAVLYRTVAPEAEYLFGELMADGIEVALDLGLTVKSTRLGHAFLTLLAAAADREQEEVSVSAYVLSAYSAYEHDEAIEIDRHLRRKRLRGRAALKHLWSRGQKKPVDQTTSDGAVEKVMKYTKGASAVEWASVVDMLLHSSISKANSPYHKDLDGAAHKAIVGVLSQLELVEERISASSLFATLTSTQVHITPRPGDRGVFIADMNRARGRVFETVILAGLASDSFHHRADYSAQDLVAAEFGVVPLLHEVPSAALTAMPLDQEMFFHCQLLHMASDRIVFAAQHITSTGDKVLPSSFLEEVISHIEIENNFEEKAHGKGGVQNLFETSCVTMSSPELLDEESHNTAARESASMRLVADVDRIGELVSGELILSPSQVESISSCPFYWLLSRVIGGDEIDAQIGHREHGTVAHFILQQVIESWISNCGKPIREVDVSHLVKTVDSVVQDLLEKAGAVANDDEYASQIRMVEEVYDNDPLAFAYLVSGIKALLQKEPLFGKQIGEDKRPVATELRLGYDSELSLQGVRMRGTIDRVDSDGQTAVIVDYKGKSSTYGTAKTQIKKGYIQNALYIRMLQRAIECGEVELLDSQTVEGAYYRGYNEDKVDHGIYRRVSTPVGGGDRYEKDYDDLMEQVDNLLAVAIGRAQEGQVATAGMKTEKCSWCPHVFCEYRGEMYV